MGRKHLCKLLLGNDVYNANKIEFTNGYTNNANLLAIMNGRWRVVTPTGQTAQWVNGVKVYGIPPDQLAALNANATIWQPLKSAGAFYPSSWAIEDGSFLRINNVTIGYTFPLRSCYQKQVDYGYILPEIILPLLQIIQDTILRLV